MDKCLRDNLNFCHNENNSRSNSNRDFEFAINILAKCIVLTTDSEKLVDENVQIPSSVPGRDNTLEFRAPISPMNIGINRVYHKGMFTYEGRNIGKTDYGEMFFLKLLRDSNCLREVEVLKKVKERSCVHFPTFYDFGRRSDGRRFVVMTLLGKNLESVMNAVRFSTVFSNGPSYSTCLAVAMQTLNAIEELHHCGFVSRDIKPENFLMGRRFPDTGMIYLVDFSLSRRYVDDDGTFMTDCPKRFSGTAYFCSIAQHQKESPSRVDDLEAWLYTLIYLFDGILEWSNILRCYRKRICTAKLELRNKPIICRKFPEMMMKMMRAIDATDRLACPDYQKLYDLIEAEMRIHNCTLDVEYDWEFLERADDFGSGMQEVNCIDNDYIDDDVFLPGVFLNTKTSDNKD